MKKRRAISWIGDMASYVLAMSGMFVRDMTPARIAVTAIIAAMTVLILITGYVPRSEVVIPLFVAGLIGRYVFLFASFTPRGIAAFLKRRLGPRRGYMVYEAATALQFFYRGLTFSWLLSITGVGLPAPWDTLVRSGGLAVAAVGTIVNTWSTDIIGVRSYYYGDLFDGPASKGEFKVQGPYRYLSNPMYGIGQCAGYGAAIMALSPAGVVATLINQGLMYVFNALIEHPHVMRVLARRAEAEERGAAPLRVSPRSA